MITYTHAVLVQEKLTPEELADRLSVGIDNNLEQLEDLPREALSEFKDHLLHMSERLKQIVEGRE